MNTTKQISKIISSPRGFEISHATQLCKLLIILLHGYGSSGDDLISLVPYMKEDLMHAYWFAPNGIQNSSIRGGYQWFAYIPEDLARMREDMDRSRTAFFKLIDTKREELGLTREQVV